MPPDHPRRPGPGRAQPSGGPRPSRPAELSDTPSGPPPPGRALDPLVGREIAGHQIIKRVATSRLCSTYLATHTAMGRTVALKALSPEADRATVERFHATAKYAAQLHHPNVVSIYDVITAEGVHFCTMEHVEGQTVGELLRARQKIPSADAIRVALDVADALRFGNLKGVPGWRLSADRVVLSTRGEVKLLPPTFTPPNAPVLDDRYVITAVGVLLYAILTGGRVHDLEYALEPGSAAPAQLRRLKNAAPGIRQDIALVVDRMVGLTRDPFPTLDAAVNSLRALLAAKEQVESRTRSVTERARERSRRTLHAVYIGLGAVALAALVTILLVVGRGAAKAGADRRFAEAATAAEASLRACKDAQKQFLAAPSEALAQQALAHLEKARAAYANFATRYPNHPEARRAEESARAVADAIATFSEESKAELRHAAGRLKIEEVDKALEREVARLLDKGGEINLDAWRKAYRDIQKDFADSPKTVARIEAICHSLPQHIQRAQMKIETNHIARDIEQNLLPKLQYGKALDAWEAYRWKYDRIDALRKEALTNYELKTEMIRREARVQHAQLANQAEYHVQKGEYDKAREIYNRIIANFGIPDYVDRAKAALAKLPQK